MTESVPGHVSLATFGHLIQERRILTDRHDSQLSEYKARQIFIDGSALIEAKVQPTRK